jgi:hypothetical protein
MILIDYKFMEEVNVLESKMGRPVKPEYRKKTMRYSRVEDSFRNILDKFESEKDRKLILNILEELKA